MNRSTHKFTLGELEAEIMEIVWELNRASVRDVLTLLKKRRDIAYTTAMTVMARLNEKGVLTRKPAENGAYIYTPVKTREAFLADASKGIIEGLIKEFGEVAIAQFINVIEGTSTQNASLLRQRLKKVR